jgi:hypothetical protein
MRQEQKLTAGCSSSGDSEFAVVLEESIPLMISRLKALPVLFKFPESVAQRVAGKAKAGNYTVERVLNSQCSRENHRN